MKIYNIIIKWILGYIGIKKNKVANYFANKKAFQL